MLYGRRCFCAARKGGKIDNRTYMYIYSALFRLLVGLEGRGLRQKLTNRTDYMHVHTCTYWHRRGIIDFSLNGWMTDPELIGLRPACKLNISACIIASGLQVGLKVAPRPSRNVYRFCRVLSQWQRPSKSDIGRTCTWIGFSLGIGRCMYTCTCTCICRSIGQPQSRY